MARIKLSCGTAEAPARELRPCRSRGCSKTAVCAPIVIGHGIRSREASKESSDGELPRRCPWRVAGACFERYHGTTVPQSSPGGELHAYANVPAVKRKSAGEDSAAWNASSAECMVTEMSQKPSIATACADCAHSGAMPVGVFALPSSVTISLYSSGLAPLTKRLHAGSAGHCAKEPIRYAPARANNHVGRIFLEPHRELCR
jgi:hypothetical protein